MKKKSSWNFYCVKIIKQILIQGEPDPSKIDESFYENNNEQTFEESLMVVHAQSFRHAYKIAEQKSLLLEIPYRNIYEQKVLWKFIKAVDCYLILDNLTSGTEVYSCFHTTDKNTSAAEFIDKHFDLE